MMKETINSVLFLTYFFPPLGGIGVQRSAKFVKYLPESGWNPVVLTVQPNARNSIEQTLDLSLLNDVKINTEVIRSRPLEFANLYAFLHRLHLRKLLFEFERLIPLLHMDYKIGWYFCARRQAEKRIKGSEIKAIYSSSPPYSANLLGHRLKSIYGLPWIADFRDPWTQMGNYKPPTPIHRWIDERFESAVMQNADAIIANTGKNRVDLIRKFEVDGKKVHVIPNGFDPTDFQHLAKIEPDSSRFVVACVGKFYEMPELEGFFRAYRRFAEKHKSALLRLVGWNARAVIKAAKAILPNDTWESMERVTHSDATVAMKKASLLLANLPKELGEHAIPGKLYEYLAARRPILLVGPEKGDAAQILRKTRAGRVAGYDEHSIYEALEDGYNLCSNGLREWCPDLKEIALFDRKSQAQNLARVFDRLCRKKEMWGRPSVIDPGSAEVFFDG